MAWPSFGVIHSAPCYTTQYAGLILPPSSSPTPFSYDFGLILTLPGDVLRETIIKPLCQNPCANFMYTFELSSLSSISPFSFVSPQCFHLGLTISQLPTSQNLWT